MKKYFKILILLPFFSWGQVGIGTTTPNGALDIQSSNNGLVIPRVQLTSITDNVTVVNPNATPLLTSTLVYNLAPAGVVPNNVVAGFYYWNSIASRWIAVNGVAGWELDGNAAITNPAVPVTYGTSIIGATENFLGTTDANDITFGTNNIERMRVKSTTGNVGIGVANPSSTLEIVSNATTELKLSSRGGFGPTRFSMISDKELPNEWRPTFIESADNGGFTGRMDFFTNGTGIANKFGSMRAMSITNGNVGIGTITPNLSRLQVDGMIGNTTALFRGNSTTSQGISMIADWPGIYFNSYYNGAIRSMAGSGFTSIINTDQSSGGLVFQTTNVINPASGSAIASVPVRMTIAGNGNVGIGSPAPSNLLHVNSATSGAVRIVDGTQATGRVLTSNATGVGTWKEIGINNVVGVLSNPGVTINYNTGPYLQTGSIITLPPGRYAVNVNMLMARSSLAISPNDSFFWVRSTFSDSSGASPAPSPDIVGSNLISGNHPGTSYYSMLTGTIVINNTSVFNKTYYYVAGSCVSANTTQNITEFGSTYWAEDNIIAYRLN